MVRQRSPPRAAWWLRSSACARIRRSGAIKSLNFFISGSPRADPAMRRARADRLRREGEGEGERGREREREREACARIRRSGAIKSSNHKSDPAVAQIVAAGSISAIRRGAIQPSNHQIGPGALATGGRPNASERLRPCLHRFAARTARSGGVASLPPPLRARGAPPTRSGHSHPGP